MEETYKVNPPPVSSQLYEIWLLWFTLTYLERATSAALPTIPARQLREAVRPYCLSNDHRDDAIRVLRRVSAISVLNRCGSRNKRYGLTYIGRWLMEQYHEMLQRGRL